MESGTAMNSFNSADTNYSTGGLYDPNKTRDQAQAVTLSAATNAVQLDGSVKGMGRTGPGGQVSADKGSEGDANCVNSGNAGIESGHFSDDPNFSYSDVTLPPVSIWLPPLPRQHTINP